MSFYEELKAFPVNTEWDYGGEQGYKTAGMNMRDYFAAKAMQAFVAKFDIEIPEYKIAEAAYWMADEMLAARETKE